MEGENMKQTVLVFLLLLLVAFTPTAFAQTSIDAEANAEVNAEAGVTPDSALYGLDLAMEKIRLALTFNMQKRAELSLKMAKERMQEARLMVAERKNAAFGKAKAEHKAAVESARTSWAAAEKTDAEAVVEFEEEAEMQEYIATEAEMEAQAEFKAEFNEMKEEARRVKQKAKEERETFRAEMKERGMAEADINAAFESAQANVGVNVFLKTRAEARIKNAKECLDEAAKKTVIEAKSEQYLHMQTVAGTHLNSADAVFKAEAYGRAYGQANAAWVICESALRYLKGESIEKVRKDFEDIESESSENVKISFKCDGIKTEVKVELDRNGVKEKTEFILEGCADREEIVAEIDARTSLTREEAEMYIGANLNVYTKFKFRVEEEKERQQELMANMVTQFGEQSEWAQKMREKLGGRLVVKEGASAEAEAEAETEVGEEGASETEAEAEVSFDINTEI